MPFRNYSQFTSGALKIMTTAYDAVIAKLDIAPSDPRNSQIASKIVRLVSEGETDVTILCDKTCAAEQVATQLAVSFFSWYWPRGRAASSF